MGSHGQSEGVVDMPPGVDEEQQQARQALWDAAAQGDVPAMQRLLDVEPGGGQSSSAVESMQRAMLEAADGLGRTGLLQAAWGGYGDAIRLLLNHPFADPAAMMMHTTKLGGNALTLAAYNGHVDAMRVLLDHPSADPAAMMMRATSNGATALTLAAYNGHVDAMRVLLYHLSPEAAVVMVSSMSNGRTALLLAAYNGHLDAVRLLLDHPSANPADMLAHSRSDSGSALVLAAYNGHVDAMRQLLDHPSANPAAMLVSAISEGRPALTHAAWSGYVDAMRLLLDPAAMMMAHNSAGICALTAAALFAAGTSPSTSRTPPRSCAPLLLLLRRVPVEPQPSDAQQARMSMVMEALCEGPRSNEMFDQDQPDDVRDDCVCLLLERGAHVLRADSPVVSRIVREHALLARVPQLINEAVVGMAVMQLQQNPQDNA